MFSAKLIDEKVVYFIGSASDHRNALGSAWIVDDISVESVIIAKFLFSGMNVRVSVRRSLGQQLVIPKTAVVLRSGKQVVFTLQEGKAMWNYVHTGLENATEYVVSDKSQKGIEEGLLEGDTIIVTGNLNLAHEAAVKVSD